MENPSGIDLVIFDMDGVIFEGQNFWLDLHRALQTEERAWALWNEYGRSDYARLCTLTVEDVWHGKSAAAFWELISARRYVDGVLEVFAWLRAHRIRTAIVSSGPYQLAERAMRDLSVDRILANRVLIEDGKFAGAVDVMVDENRKDDAARQIMTELGADRARTAMIGDSKSDARMAAIVGLPIAYNPQDPELVSAVDAVIPAGRLASLVDILARYK
jgi:phosphoserine phosphatase